MPNLFKLKSSFFGYHYFVIIIFAYSVMQFSAPLRK